MKYLVVVERGPRGWGAHVPDLPGCIAAAETREEVLDLVREAIQLHIEDLTQRGDPVPPPTSEATVIEIPAA